MKFIVVGVGFWGKEWVELLWTHPQASVVGTVDKSEAAADWSQQTFGIPCFADLATATAKTSADAVLVVTNPSQHKPVILEALHLLKHVLVEKPMVTSMEEAAEIATAAEQAPGKVMAAQGYRFMKAAGLVRERLALGDIGELQAVKIRFRKHLPDLIANREHSIYALPHSILLDMSVHHVDLLRFMTQHEVTSVLEHFIDSIGRGQQPEPSIEDNRKTLAVVFGSLESVLKKQEVRL
jgi:predicted dehydrogenase